MNWSNLMAEQTVFASINIERIPAVQSMRQIAMTDIAYMKNSAEPKSQLDHQQYRITNLPDTFAYVPKNSVFENIILFHAALPDFRFVPINQVTNTGIRTTDVLRPLVITDQIQPGDSYLHLKPRITHSMFTSQLAAQQTMGDAVFNDLGGNVQLLQNYETLRVTVAGLINKNKGDVNDPSWVNDLYAYGQYSKAFVAMVTMQNSQIGDNVNTVTIRVINSLSNLPHDRDITSDTMNKVNIEIKRTVSAHVQNKQEQQNIDSERQRQITANELNQVINETIADLEQKQAQQDRIRSEQSQAEQQAAVIAQQNDEMIQITNRMQQ